MMDCALQFGDPILDSEVLDPGGTIIIICTLGRYGRRVCSPLDFVNAGSPGWLESNALGAACYSCRLTSNSGSCCEMLFTTQ